MFKARVLLVILVSIAYIYAKPVTEREAVIRALTQSSEARSIKIDLLADSLALIEANAEFRPSASIEITGSSSPLDSISQPPRIRRDIIVLPDSSVGFQTTIDNLSSNNPHNEAGSVLSLSQHIPGGGDVKASLNQTILAPKIGESNHSTIVSLGLVQPLLKGAWLYDDARYSVRMARIDREKFSIRQKTNLLSHATKARRSYWNLYAQKTLMQISQNELRRSNDLLEVKRNEFKIGEASVLDTMSAALEMLKAQQGLITSTVELDNAKNELALDVTLSSDSIDISDSVDFHISDLPPADSLIKMVEDYDPELRIFERAAEQIRIQSEQSKNSLLPSLDFSATLSRSLAGNKYLSENVANRNAVFALILKYALPQTRTQNSFKQLQYNAEKNELTKENYRAELRNRLSQLQLKWQLEKSRIAISEAARELAAKQLVAYEKRYELGTADRLELLKARDDLISAEIDLLRSRINMKNLEITFDELTGGLFYRFGVNLQ